VTVNTKRIVITQHDLDRLRTVVNDAAALRTRDDLLGLIRALDRALIVEPHEVPGDVVTMNSKVQLADVETADQMKISLVFPDDTEAKRSQNRRVVITLRPVVQ